MGLVMELEMMQAVCWRITDLMKEIKLSKYALAKKTGISHQSIDDMLNGKTKDIKLSILAKIVSALCVDLSEFFENVDFDIETKGVDFDNDPDKYTDIDFLIKDARKKVLEQKRSKLWKKKILD